MALSGLAAGGFAELGEVAFESTEDDEKIVAEGETLREIANPSDLCSEQLTSYSDVADFDQLGGAAPGAVSGVRTNVHDRDNLKHHVAGQSACNAE